MVNPRDHDGISSISTVKIGPLLFNFVIYLLLREHLCVSVVLLVTLFQLKWNKRLSLINASYMFNTSSVNRRPWRLWDHLQQIINSEWCKWHWKCLTNKKGYQVFSIRFCIADKAKVPGHSYSLLRDSPEMHWVESSVGDSFSSLTRMSISRNRLKKPSHYECPSACLYEKQM